MGVLAMRRQGETFAAIVAETGYHPATISKWVRAGDPLGSWHRLGPGSAGTRKPGGELARPFVSIAAMFGARVRGTSSCRPALP